MGDTRIDGPGIYLRTLAESDASEKYAAWLNDPVVNEFLETRSATVEELRAYIAQKNVSQSALLLGIFVSDTDAHIGNVKLEPIDEENSTATMGILIGEKEWWGKGVATDVTNLMVAYAFATLGLRSVRLGVIANNLAARRVYEKCGFVVERVDKNAIDHDGNKFDQVWMIKINRNF